MAVTIKGTQTLCCLFVAHSCARLTAHVHLFETPKHFTDGSLVVIRTISAICTCRTCRQLLVLTVLSSPANVALTITVQTSAVARTVVRSITNTFAIQAPFITHISIDSDARDTCHSLTALTDGDRCCTVGERTRADWLLTPVTAES
eukprot:TRINITY_DN5163_c0_g1_i1.p3 TRINITY_DN5163_c0_g1~~TRINITY_DN5163_c0_g1_i1.p3  ORF type:complete len:147 (-),score=14.78 TRINITY_DN5163_c0_g1_i1:1564-2004(-)